MGQQGPPRVALYCRVSTANQFCERQERDLAERFFNKPKQFRRVAIRYDKLLSNYKGFVQLAAVAILLR